MSSESIEQQDQRPASGRRLHFNLKRDKRAEQPLWLLTVRRPASALAAADDPAIVATVAAWCQERDTDELPGQLTLGQITCGGYSPNPRWLALHRLSAFTGRVCYDLQRLMSPGGELHGLAELPNTRRQPGVIEYGRFTPAGFLPSAEWLDQLHQPGIADALAADLQAYFTR